MHFSYPAVFHRQENGTWKGEFPDLAGCGGEGETLDLAIRECTEAARERLRVELTEFDGDLPEVSEPGDLSLKEGDIVRQIGVIVRLTDGFDE